MARLILAPLLLVGIACAAAATGLDAPRNEPVAVHVEAVAGTSRGDRLLLPGGTLRSLQARIEFVLPEAAADQRWVLWLAHDPLDLVRVSGPGWAPSPVRFFAPDVNAGTLLFSTGFVLPRGASGPQRLAIEIRGSVRSAPTLRVMSEQDVLRHAGREIALAYAVYAALATLLIATLALYSAARDQLFLLFAGSTAMALLFLAAFNGHLYTLPGASALGMLGARGFWLLMLAYNAMALWVLLRFADTRVSANALVRSLAHLVPVTATAAALMLLPDRVLSGWHQAIATSAWMLAMPASMAAMLDGARRGKPMAVATACALFALLLAATANEAMNRGMIDDGFLPRYGFQFALVLMSVTLFVGLSSRIGAVRQRLDDEASARRDGEQRLRRVRARSDLALLLQERLRGLHPEEVALQAFQLLIGHAKELMPGAQAVVLGQRCLGHDLVLVHAEGAPTTLGQSVLAGRSVVRAQVRSHKPVQLRLRDARISDDPDAPLYQLVPLPLTAPAWAALVMRLPEQNVPEEADLETCMELARLTAAHAEEAHAAILLRRTAEHDALTGTMNRRSLDLVLAREFTHARLASLAFTVLFIDIDWFKRVNDEHGHAAGDHCLRSIANTLRAELRPTDAFGRYGGEEFLVALPGRDAAASRIIAERLRVVVERGSIEWQGRPLALTISIGLAARRHPDTRVEDMLDRADKALYAAKREGRNRVCVAPAVFG